MRTSKPISTISYNTKSFLKMKLDELVSSHKISDYMFIVHTAEEDELKDHIHLFIQPNTLLDTMDLQDHFKELDPKNPDKPFGCINFQYSERDDWILYCEHNPVYLQMKGQSREFIYSKEDFVFCDINTFERNYIHALKGSKFAEDCKQLSVLKNLLNGEVSPYDVFLNNMIPLNKASSISSLFNLQGLYLDRNGGKTHSPKQTSG